MIHVMLMILYRYDMILTSETIYSPVSYKKLHNVMASVLRPNGVMYPLLCLQPSSLLSRAVKTHLKKP